MAVVTIQLLGASFSISSDDDQGPPTFRGATEVIAGRIADEPGEIGRREVIIERDEIARLPVQTLQDLLAALPGVGLTRRGARGVQGDLNLRGSTFEQSVVMVNGVRVNNPQTGHHNLDLFIPLEAIERVEVLYGPGSAVHGPDVFGGAVNIVTRVVSRAAAYLRVGENNLTGGGISGSVKGLWASAEREVHTGFRDNTEHDVNQGAAGWSWAGERSRLELTASAGRRRFGAHAFYSTRFPDEREHTEGRLLMLSSETTLGKNLILTSALRLIRHEDDFILDRHRPDWFHNHHVTNGALAQAELRGRHQGWSWVTGIEASHDEIRSSNLGDHRSDRTALFAEAGYLDGPLTFALQGRVDHHDSWDTVSTAAIGGRWKIRPALALRASWGSSFRAPSFTDLYYRSPATEGNPGLEPERGRTLEVGLEAADFYLTVFRRQADPIIDYVLDADGIWRAQNLGRITTTGIEAGYDLAAIGPIRHQRIGVTWLESDIATDPTHSRYALAHPRLEAAWTGVVDSGGAWRAGWALRFRDPSEGGSWTALDLRLSRRILPTMWIELEGNNAFDRELTEFHGVPLPGRWVSVSAKWEIPTQ